ncbi:HXXEE domain-containing protein [Streptococcus mutans]|uniref:HXXEE domain-containing protein n=1 Tax=Streptococcus mutans TaxID=1309 RepID=UPI0002EEBC8C|nr:HXXEE domain-containing protein [Streptococcus mutans]MCY7123525.1 HXXEE domain-containing protein [Streptococcus mutans]
MTAALFAFIAITLFMIHEFEEIILVCPWIAKNKNDPKFANEIFISGRKHYPSAENIAVAVLEEFVLASLILLAGILFRVPELVLAITLGHTFHLFSHISQAITYRTWVPGSITAALTLPLLVMAIMGFCFAQSLSWMLLLMLTVLIFPLQLVNLRFIHQQTDKVEKFLHS